MKRILLAILALSVVACLLSTPASATTISNLKMWDYSHRGGYWVSFQFRMTAADADPSDDAGYAIPAEVWRVVKGGMLIWITVAGSGTDADPGITITDSDSIEWFDETWTNASLPYGQTADTTLGYWPPVSTTGYTIATDTDWTTQAAAWTDYITVTLHFIIKRH